MLCGPAVPLLKLSISILFPIMVVILFSTSLAFTLPLLPCRRELQFTTLSNRRKFHMCQTMLKCLNSLSPLYLTRLFDPPSTHHSTRASTTKQLNLSVTCSSLAKELSALQVLWHGNRYQAMLSVQRLLTFCKLHNA